MDIGSVSVDYKRIPQSVSSSKTDAWVNGKFVGTLSNIQSTNQATSDTVIVLHGKNDADAGEESVGSWASFQTGVSTSVYKPTDFSKENPYYHIKIWKPDGTMEERQVDVIIFNPKSADSFDHYTYTCYLEKEEGA